MVVPDYILSFEDPETSEVSEVRLPGRYEVCDRCDGTGKHDHPAFNGFTGTELAQDFGAREDYFRGENDVTCTACKGLHVLLHPDEEQLSPEQQDIWTEHLRQQEAAASFAAHDAAYAAAERAFGC